MISLPLFASSIAAYVAVCMSESAVSLIWIAACLIMQVINCFRIIEGLPPDYNVTPFCGSVLICFKLFLFFSKNDSLNISTNILSLLLSVRYDYGLQSVYF